MQIEWVKLSDFRSYRTLSFTPAPNLNILTGPNAQGKTNLLEGLGVLLVGRSFRGAKPLEWLRWEAASATIAGELRLAETALVVRRVVARGEDGSWILDGEGCPWARAIPFSWSDLTVLTGAPQARRNFVDGFAAKLYPAHIGALNRYRQILARRNFLLQSRLDVAELRARLAPWNEQLARFGTELVRRREAAVEVLGAEAGRLYPMLAGQGGVRVTYCSTAGAGPGEEGFIAGLEERLGEEARRGQTLVGPHRDDLRIEVDGRDLRVYGSRGQQRLMALTLRLAEAQPVAAAVGTRPVLLLDDALSELDPGVQARVLAHAAAAGQVFLTTAEGGLPGAGGAWWEVKGGHVSDLAPEAVRGAA